MGYCTFLPLSDKLSKYMITFQEDAFPRMPVMMNIWSHLNYKGHMYTCGGGTWSLHFWKSGVGVGGLHG